MVRSQADNAETFTIGTLAERSGVNVETIRYYQRRGLLQAPERVSHGFRRYSMEYEKRVRFIKRAQGLGFTLDEIQSLLVLDEEKACAETRMFAAHKIATIERKVTDLEKIRSALERLVRSCDEADAGTSCPIIHLLIQD